MYAFNTANSTIEVRYSDTLAFNPLQDDNVQLMREKSKEITRKLKNRRSFYEREKAA